MIWTLDCPTFCCCHERKQRERIVKHCVSWNWSLNIAAVLSAAYGNRIALAWNILCKFGERGECGTLEVINHLILTGELEITCLALCYACDLFKTQLTNMLLIHRNLFHITFYCLLDFVKAYVLPLYLISSINFFYQRTG